MLVNNTLTLSNTPPNSPSELALSIQTAVLTTLLIYQLSSALFDLLLGHKPHGEAPASTIATALLAEQAAPLACLAALFPDSYLATRRHHGNQPCPLHASRDVRPPLPSNRQLARFAFLVLLSPVLALLGVALAVEQERSVTFSDAGVGLALGLAPRPRIDRQSSLECFEHSALFESSDTPVATAFSCAHFVATPTARKFPDSAVTATFRLERETGAFGVEGAIVGVFKNTTYYRRDFFYADLLVGEEAFRVQPNVRMEQGITVVKQFMQKVTNGCELRPLVVSGGDGSWEMEQVSTCKTIMYEDVLAAHNDLAETFSLIDAETLPVLPAGEIEMRYTDGGSLHLLTRRAALGGIRALWIAAGAAVLLRFAARILLNNDVHRGVELLLKRAVGVGSCESLLMVGGSVKFDEVMAGVIEK